MSKGAEVTGLFTDILKQALRRADIAYSITVYPWLRAYDMALRNADTCVYSIIPNDQREPLFKWVGPVAKNDWVFFAKADSDIKLASFDDAKHYKIGAFSSDAIDLFLRDKGLAPEESVDDRQLLRRLMAGHIELWASGSLRAPYVAAQHDGEAIKPVLLFKETSLFMACNKSVPDAVIDRLNNAIRQMSADGSAPNLSKAYQ